VPTEQKRDSSAATTNIPHLLIAKPPFASFEKNPGRHHHPGPHEWLKILSIDKPLYKIREAASMKD
jgi:hypothetical protein